MPTVPILRPRRVVKTFEKLGWEVVRQQGSHIILTKEEPVNDNIEDNSMNIYKTVVSTEHELR